MGGIAQPQIPKLGQAWGCFALGLTGLYYTNDPDQGHEMWVVNTEAELTSLPANAMLATIRQANLNRRLAVRNSTGAWYFPV